MNGPAPELNPLRSAPRVLRVEPLTSAAASDPAQAGAKAANLARAARAGLPVLPGVVITAHVPDAAAPHPGLPAAVAAAHTALSGLAGPAGRGGESAARLVARSSSTVEDLGASSMAGRFTSVLGLAGAADLARGVATVLASAQRAADDDGTAPQPMAVLIQPELDILLGGVLFGVDPLDAAGGHLLVEFSTDGPDALVSGRAVGVLATLSHRGRLIEGDPDASRLLPRRLRHGLAGLARQAERAFGGPQDIEWAVDRRGRLWLLQARPVTAASGAAAAEPGPLLGPGPLAETFPLPLRPLELDLWLAPLRSGMAEALAVLGTSSRRQLQRSPIVTSVGGWAVCDLHLAGIADRRSGWRALTPGPALRHLRSAWRVGSLRASLAGRCAALTAEVDRQLAAVPPLAEVGDADLVALLESTAAYAEVLHTHQMLAAVLHADGDSGRAAGGGLGGAGTTVAGLALDTLARERAAGGSDAEIVAREPVVLALVSPRIGGLALPPTPGPAASADLTAAPAPAAGTALATLTSREALRLRLRWLQELAARAAAELSRRRFGPDDAIAALTLAQVAALAGPVAKPEPGPTTNPATCCAGGAATHLERGAAIGAEATLPVLPPFGPPVPTAFRLDAAGNPVPQRLHARGGSGGRGASPGRAEGVAVTADAPAAGGVLVVASLDPRLAPQLGQVAGIVAETGSVLSHLAILARERGVPVAVGVPDAVRRFPPGSHLALDGATGEVRRLP